MRKPQSLQPPPRSPSHPTTPFYLTSFMDRSHKRSDASRPISATNDGKTALLRPTMPMPPMPMPLCANFYHSLELPPQSKPPRHSLAAARSKLSQQPCRHPLVTGSTPFVRVPTALNNNNHRPSQKSTSISLDIPSRQLPLCQHHSPIKTQVPPKTRNQTPKTRSKPCFRIRTPTTTDQLQFPSFVHKSLDAPLFSSLLDQPHVPTNSSRSPKSHHQGIVTKPKPCFRVPTIVNSNNNNHSQNFNSLSLDTPPHQPPLRPKYVPTQPPPSPKSRSQQLETSSKPCFCVHSLTNGTSHCASTLKRNSSLVSQSPPNQLHRPFAQAKTWLPPKSCHQGKIAASNPSYCISNSTFHYHPSKYSPKSQHAPSNHSYSHANAAQDHEQMITSPPSSTLIALQRILADANQRIAETAIVIQQMQASISKADSSPFLPLPSCSKPTRLPTMALPTVLEHPPHQQKPPKRTPAATAQTKRTTIPTFMSILMEANSFATYNRPFSFFSPSPLLTLVPWHPPCLFLSVWIAHVDRIFIRHRKEIHQDTTL